MDYVHVLFVILVALCGLALACHAGVSYMANRSRTTLGLSKVPIGLLYLGVLIVLGFAWQVEKQYLQSGEAGSAILCFLLILVDIFILFTVRVVQYPAKFEDWVGWEAEGGKVRFFAGCQLGVVGGWTDIRAFKDGLHTYYWDKPIHGYQVKLPLEIRGLADKPLEYDAAIKEQVERLDLLMAVAFKDLLPPSPHASRDEYADGIWLRIEYVTKTMLHAQSSGATIRFKEASVRPPAERREIAC